MGVPAWISRPPAPRAFTWDITPLTVTLASPVPAAGMSRYTVPRVPRQVAIRGVRVTDSAIGVASKDRSRTRVEGSSFSGIGRAALMAYG